MMESLAAVDPGGLILLVIVLGIALGALLSYLSARSKAMKDTLQRVAQRVGGRFVEGGFLSENGLWFPIGGRGANLEFYGGSKNSSPYTRVVVDVRGRSPGTLHILEQGFGQEFLKMFGAQDLLVGDPAFDAAYVIKATPTSLATRVFSPERRLEVIRTVRRLQGYSIPTIDLDHQVMTATVRQYLREEHALMTLIETATAFVGFILQSPAPTGVVMEEVRISTKGECPVCGTEMKDLVVRCESCRTPHHYECWQYMGRCSTYACKGIRSVA